MPTAAASPIYCRNYLHCKDLRNAERSVPTPNPTSMLQSGNIPLTPDNMPATSPTAWKPYLGKKTVCLTRARDREL